MAHNRNKKKKKFLVELEVVPIVQIACDRVGVPRSTYYRWKKEDSNFSSQVEESLLRGKGCVNDLARSKLLKKIAEEERWALQYWLTHNDRDFMKPERVKATPPEGPRTIAELMSKYSSSKDQES